GRVDGGIAIQLIFYFFEEREQSARYDESKTHHRGDVEQIFVMPSVEVRQRLRVEIKVVKRDDAYPTNELATVDPTAQRRHEVRRRRKFDVDVKSFLQLWDCAQDSIALRNDRQVNVHRVFTPMFEDSTRPAGEVDAAWLARFDGDRAHEGAEPRLIYGLTHSAACSKLTSLRINAL